MRQWVLKVCGLIAFWLLCLAGGARYGYLAIAQPEPLRFPAGEASPLPSRDAAGGAAPARLNRGADYLPEFHPVFDDSVQPTGHSTVAARALLMAQGSVGAAPSMLQLEFPSTGAAAINLLDANLPKPKLLNTGSIAVSGTFQGANNKGVLLLVNGSPRISTFTTAEGTFRIEVQLSDGNQKLQVGVSENGRELVKDSSSSEIFLHVRSTAVVVDSIDYQTLENATGPYQIRVRFNSGELNLASAANPASFFSLYEIDAAGNKIKDTPERIASATFDAPNRTAELNINANTPPGLYRLKVIGGSSGVLSTNGNLLAGNAPPGLVDFIRDIVKPVGGIPPLVRPGLSGATAPYVAYPEFTQPRTVPPGFNPHDKVESRVVRLYYFRDAHRVAQILNRKATSHNRAAVDMAQQLAEKARTYAQQRTADRQAAERAAIRLEQQIREQEQSAAVAQANLQRTVEELRFAT